MADSGDDFGDFTGFSTANGSSSGTSHQASKDLKPSKWSNASNQEATFASPQDQNISGNGTSNFAFSNITSGTGGYANSAQFDMGGINMADIDIPLPSSPLGADIHVAGGVPFDIPPLPDSCSFDEDFPPLSLPKDSPVELVGKGLGSSITPSYSETTPATPDSTVPTPPLSENSVSNITTQRDTVEKNQPIEHFESSKSSSDTTTTQVLFQDSKQQDDSWKQNPNPSGEVIQPVIDELPNEIEGTSWNADFGSFETCPPVSVKQVLHDEELPKADSLPETSNTIPGVTSTSKMTDLDIGEFAEFSTFESGDSKRGKDDESSSASTDVVTTEESFGDFSNFRQTESSSNFANFVAFDSKSNTDIVSTVSGGTTDVVYESSTGVSSKQTTVPVNDDFGEFGAFSDSQASSQVVPSLQQDTSTDSCVTFSKSEGTVKDVGSTNATEDGFGDFTGGGTGFQGDSFGFKASGVSDDFGDFTSGVTVEFGATFEDNSGFGDFSASNVQTPTPAASIGGQGVQVRVLTTYLLITTCSSIYMC